MSLVLGVNLPDLLYLVADTRLTHKLNGENFYQDNFSKFYSFNEDISVVTAGNAKLANYLLRKISSAEILTKGFIHFENNIKSFLSTSINEYLSNGNGYASVFFIFAGFDKNAKKKINSSSLGKFYSNPLLKKKGVQHQTMNKKIIEGLVGAILKNKNNLPANANFDVDLPYSKIIGVEINLPNEINVKGIDCFKYVMRAPEKLTEDNISQEVIYKLDQTKSSSKTGEAILCDQATILIGLVNQLINNHKLKTVGGSIMVNIITPHGALIPPGSCRYLDFQTGKIEKISDILVNDEKFCTRSITGDIIPLQNIYDFKNEGHFEL